jgi:hypothetical protein
MTIAELKRAVGRQPFAPFVLLLADGRELLVGHHQQIAWPDEEGDTAIAYIRSRDEFDILDVSQITSLRWLPLWSPNGDGEGEK